MKTLDQTPSCSPVLSGGFWKPSGCLPRQRVAIIVPYRDREPHLKIFLQIIHPFLQKQLLQYTVFIVEQVTRFYVHSIDPQRTERTFDSQSINTVLYVGLTDVVASIHFGIRILKAQSYKLQYKLSLSQFYACYIRTRFRRVNMKNICIRLHNS